MVKPLFLAKTTVFNYMNQIQVNTLDVGCYILKLSDPFELSNLEKHGFKIRNK